MKRRQRYCSIRCPLRIAESRAYVVGPDNPKRLWAQRRRQQES